MGNVLHKKQQCLNFVGEQITYHTWKPKSFIWNTVLISKMSLFFSDTGALQS